jgi:hypothetical protein
MNGSGRSINITFFTILDSCNSPIENVHVFLLSGLFWRVVDSALVCFVEESLCKYTPISKKRYFNHLPYSEYLLGPSSLWPKGERCRRLGERLQCKLGFHIHRIFVGGPKIIGIGQSDCFLEIFKLLTLIVLVRLAVISTFINTKVRLGCHKFIPTWILPSSRNSWSPAQCL